MARDRARVPFGPGLDRATGAAAVQPSSMKDARNVYARDDKLALRAGMQTTAYPAIPWGTDVVGIFPLRSKLEVIMVILDRAARTLRVYRVNPVGPTIQQAANPVGWGTLDPNAPLPRFMAAENYGRLIIAHDEPTYLYRLPTIVYTPDISDPVVGTLAVVQATDSGGTLRDVKFRGVESYLDYIVGWGFGEGSSATNANRPEIVRFSEAAAPTTFPIEAYFIAGVRDDPVTRCIPAGGVLLAAKSAETYIINGTDPATFGISLGDPLRGIVAGRLAYALGGAAYAWTESGPAVSTGGAWADLAIPLELDGPPPTSLTAAGATAYGWVGWDEERRVLEFGFPDVTTPSSPTLVFALSLREPQNPRWTYYERQQSIYTVGTFYDGKAGPPAIIGYVTAITAADAGIAADNASRKLNLSWTNNAANGDELVDIFVKPTGGAWTLFASVPVGAASQSQSFASGFDPLQTYTIAMRYRRGTQVGTGYTGSDPDAWTAPTAPGARQTLTFSCATPTQPSGTWSRVSASQAEVAMAWTLTDLYVDVAVQKSTDNVNWTTVTTLAGGTTPRSYTYVQQPGEGATTLYLRVRPVRGVTNGTASTSRSVWMGWQGLPFTQYAWCFQHSATQFGVLSLFANRTNSPGSVAFSDASGYEIQTSPDAVTWTTRASGAVGAGQLVFATGLTPEFTNGTITYVRIRASYTTFGVDDFGPWAESNSTPVTLANRFAVWVNTANTPPTGFNMVTAGAYPAYSGGGGVDSVVSLTMPTPPASWAAWAWLIARASAGAGLWTQISPFVSGGSQSVSNVTGPGRSGTQVSITGYGVAVDGRFDSRGYWYWNIASPVTVGPWNNLP